MNKSNSIEAIDKTNLTNQIKFRLDEISKIENYFIEEINQRKSCSKKVSKYVAAFDYIDKILIVLTLFRMEEWGRGGPPTSFSPVTSTNSEFGSKNSLTFSFNPLATLAQTLKFVPSASPKLFCLNQDCPSKKAIFLVKSL